MSATVIVSPGDTLSKISLMYSISPSRLTELNNLRSHDVQPGEVLKIESPLDYLASHHQQIVMLISSLDFFRESPNLTHDGDESLPNIQLQNLNECSLLRSAISGSIILTEDMLIFNQLQTGSALNKERYTFYINLISISNTKLVPFYKNSSHTQIHQKMEMKANEGRNNQNQEKLKEKNKNSSSFFKRLFASKTEQKTKIDANTSPPHDDQNDEQENNSKIKSETIQEKLSTPSINFCGVETFANNNYTDEPSVLEISFFDDPLNKSQGLKSISFFASRAELNSLDFLVNFFSRQRRIEIGLKLVSPADVPALPLKNEPEGPRIKVCHSSSLPISQSGTSTAPKKSSLIFIIRDNDQSNPQNCSSNLKNQDSDDIQLIVDGNGSFGYAVQKSISFISESQQLPKKANKVDSNRKISSLTPSANTPSSSSPLFTPKIVTKSTLDTMTPISCFDLQLSTASLDCSTASSASISVDTFSYSKYPVTLTDSTSLILDCINVTMIRMNFPHRIISLKWKLAFRLSRDGCSYHSLLDKTRDGHPCVLAILTNKGERIGAFLADGLKEGKSKTTGGSSFVFSFSNSVIKSKNMKRKNDENENENKNKSDSNSRDDINNNDDKEIDDDSNSDHDNDDKSQIDNSFDESNSSASRKDDDDINTEKDNENSSVNNNNENNESNSSSYFSRRNANIYKWSMANDKFIMVSTTDLMIGSTSISDDKDKFKDRSLIFAKYRSDFAGRFGAAIWIDQKMNKGISENCPTFNSPPLVKGGTFSVDDIEVWNII